VGCPLFSWIRRKREKERGERRAGRDELSPLCQACRSPFVLFFRKRKEGKKREEGGHSRYSNGCLISSNGKKERGGRGEWEPPIMYAFPFSPLPKKRKKGVKGNGCG